LQDPQVRQWLDGIEPTWTLLMVCRPCSGDATICCFARERANRDDKDGRPPDEEILVVCALAGGFCGIPRRRLPKPNVCDAGRLPLTHGNAFQDVINQIPQIDLRCRRHAVCGTQIRNGPGSGSYKVHNL